MNINLLPDKFIKNRASFIVLSVVSSICATTLVILIISYFILSNQIQNVDKQKMEKQGEKGAYSQKINKLKAEQSVEVIEALSKVMERQILVEKIMLDLKSKMDNTKQVIVEYNIDFPEIKEFSENSSGDDYLIVLPMEIQGYNLANLGQVIENFEQLPWIKEVQIKTASVVEENGPDFYAGELELHVESASLPAIERGKKVDANE